MPCSPVMACSGVVPDQTRLTTSCPNQPAAPCHPSSRFKPLLNCHHPRYLGTWSSSGRAISPTTSVHTFCLLVWQPAWVEQQLVRTGRLDGPITGVQRPQLIASGRQAVVDGDLPISTPP